MNDAPSPTDSTNSLDRRDFVRKSAFATGALTFAGLISAGHAGPPSTTTNTTVVTTSGYRCLWEVRDFPASSDSGTGYSSESGARLAANTKLYQRIAAATFVNDHWGSTAGLTSQAPPYLEFAGGQLVPVISYNSSLNCWEYSLNIPASQIKVYFWR